MDLPAELLDLPYCLLTTQGRVTGRRHTAELWFVPDAGGLYLMSGSGLTQWCLNLQAEEQGVVRVGDRAWLARAAFLAMDDPTREPVVHAFHDKYDRDGTDRTEHWVRKATVVQMVFVRALP